jgi:single-strand DNA-binding protein
VEYVNRCEIVGRIGKHPELRYTASGKAISDLRVAVETRRPNGTETEWFTVVLWEGLAERIEDYGVGIWVHATGRIKSRSYEGSDGSKRYVTELIADSCEAIHDPS